MIFSKLDQAALASAPPAEPLKYEGPLLPVLARHFLVVTAFNIAVALFITLVMDHKHRFLHHLVFAQSIGTVAWILIDFSRILIWGGRKPPAWKFFMLLIAASPIAYWGGAVIGALIVSLPLKELVPESIWAFIPEMVFTLVVFTIGGWIFLFRAEVADLKAQAAARQAHTAAIEKQAMQAQLQLLQTQIEPHMLFNTLANLQGLIALDPPRAQTMLDHLIQYLRATLASSRTQETTLAQEFALLDAYLGLMEVRMGARLAHGLHLPDDLAGLPVPPMLLQPLAENAIKHGLEPKVDGGRIDVRAERHGHRLVLTVADTGLGIDDNGDALCSQPGTRVGTANVRERLQVLYGDAASLNLSPNHPTGVIARVTLPIAPTTH
jgi:hypothetical protein